MLWGEERGEVWHGLQLKNEEGVWAGVDQGPPQGHGGSGEGTLASILGQGPWGDWRPPDTTQNGAMRAEHQAVGVLDSGGAAPLWNGGSGISRGLDPDQCHTQLRGSLTAAGVSVHCSRSPGGAPI